MEKFFYENSHEFIEKMNSIALELDESVSCYTEKNKPILQGKIKKYIDMLEQRNLGSQSKSIKEVIEDISPLFQRSVRWGHAGTMINVTPPSNVIASAVSSYSDFYNPNFAQDESSGYLMTSELIVSKYLSELVGWDWKKSGGIFTFGGKGTCLYALKIGISKAMGEKSHLEGIGSQDIIVISNENSHPCHKEICDWIGIGKNSCKRIGVNKDGTVDLKQLEIVLRENIKKGVKIGCIFVNGGTTNEIVVDPIKKVVNLRNKLVAEYNLDYKPHIHVDSVIGWAWLFFNQEFDFDNSDIDNEVKIKIESLSKKVSDISLADSFAADFHKTGFCPYLSSIFMASDYSDITHLGGRERIPLDSMSFGEYSPFEYTLELSRPSSGALAAYSTLEAFGREGFQKSIIKLITNSCYIRDSLSKIDNFEVINSDSEGIAVLFVVKKNNTKESFDEIIQKFNKKELDDFIEYNHQFYLFCLKKLEEDQISFKLTFSKSYKPSQSDNKTGALKIYLMSPTARKKDIKDIILQIKKMKNLFDSTTTKIIEDRKLPVDFVYRD